MATHLFICIFYWNFHHCKNLVWSAALLECLSALSLFVWVSLDSVVNGSNLSNAPGFDASWHPYESLVQLEMTSGWNFSVQHFTYIGTNESSLAKESVMWNSSKRHFLSTQIMCSLMASFSFLVIFFWRSVPGFQAEYHDTTPILLWATRTWGATWRMW